MTKDSFDAALAGFRRWTATTKRKLSADPVGEMETLLGLMRDYLDVDGPADLGAGDLRELLLSIYPRKITVFDPADTEDTVPAVRDFLAYLAERGELPKGRARALERELDEIAPRFTDVMMDPSNWGMAGSLIHAMAADGVDLDDQAAVDRWISDYNAGLTGLGDDEEYVDDDVVDLKEAFGLPDQMAPLRLPAPPELAAMARHAPLMAQLRKLAWWLGAGRAVTEEEELASGDATEAAAELGVDAARLTHLTRTRLTPSPASPRKRGTRATTTRCSTSGRWCSPWLSATRWTPPRTWIRTGPATWISPGMERRWR
jgi:hypothetical protein